MFKDKMSSPKRRLGVVTFFILVLGFGGLILRLGYLQIIKHWEYKKQVEKQYMKVTRLKPQRGMIYDRNMNVLAKSAAVWDVVISPKTFGSDDQKKQAAGELAKLLNLESAAMDEVMKKQSCYEVIKRGIEKPLADKIKKLKKENYTWPVYLEPSTKRYYLRKDFLADVLGFVGRDGVGLEGLERYYEQELKGVYGKIVGATNAWGTGMPNSDPKVFSAKDGNSLVLTIDANIQEFVEKRLAEAIEQHSVKNRAVGIVMDAKNGEILAMATKPDYDPNRPFEVFSEQKKKELEEAEDEEERAKLKLKFLQEQWRNKAVSDPYEPGSVFKIITAASALEEGTSHPEDKFDCYGVVEVGDRGIHCWRPEGHGTLSFAEALINSCNPSLVKIGLRLGQAPFIKYFKAFGFNELTGVDLPGEAECIFHDPNHFSDHDLAVSCIGQTFKTTPIQLITGVTAAINGGRLVRPHIVKEIVDENRNVLYSNGTEVKRQVISKKVSQFVADTCEKVVSGTGGGGGQAYRKGQKRGGKTGTAEQLDKEGENYTLSFLAFAPTDDPKIVVLVVLDTPNVPNPFASVIAVPVGGKILDDIYEYMNIESTYSESEAAKSVCVPNLTGKSLKEAKDALKESNLRYIVTGEKDTVEGQLPTAGVYIPEKSVVIIYTDLEQDVNSIAVPNLVGASLDSAKQQLNESGLNYELQDTKEEAGNKKATVTKQTPEAGQKVKPGSVVKLEFVYNADMQVG